LDAEYHSLSLGRTMCTRAAAVTQTWRWFEVDAPADEAMHCHRNSVTPVIVTPIAVALRRNEVPEDNRTSPIRDFPRSARPSDPAEKPPGRNRQRRAFWPARMFAMFMGLIQCLGMLGAAFGAKPIQMAIDPAGSFRVLWQHAVWPKVLEDGKNDPSSSRFSYVRVAYD
jgi:hypothetical protein